MPDERFIQHHHSCMLAGTYTDAVKQAAGASAVYLLQVQAALIALSVIKHQARSLAFTKGLRFLRKHWSSLADWCVTNFLAVEKQERVSKHSHQTQLKNPQDEVLEVLAPCFVFDEVLMLVLTTVDAGVTRKPAAADAVGMK